MSLVGGQPVQAVLHCLVATGDNAASQSGVAADVNEEAAVTSLDARLFADAGVVAVHLLLADVDTAGEADAHGHAAADRLVLALVLAGVLQAFDAQVAADVGQHLAAADHGTSAAAHGQHRATTGTAARSQYCHRRQQEATVHHMQVVREIRQYQDIAPCRCNPF